MVDFSFTFYWLFVDCLFIKSFQKIQKIAYVHIVYKRKKSIKSQSLIKKSQTKVKKSQKKCASEKKSKNFSKVNFFDAFPNIFKVTYRRSSEQQRICIYTLLYSFWTYAIFWFFWSISLTTSRYLHNLVICSCSKYVQIKRCFNIHFENDWFSLKETTLQRAFHIHDGRAPTTSYVAACSSFLCVYSFLRNCNVFLSTVATRDRKKLQLRVKILETVKF